jgi:hypothetical protein
MATGSCQMVLVLVCFRVPKTERLEPRNEFDESCQRFVTLFHGLCKLLYLWFIYGFIFLYYFLSFFLQTQER